MVTYISVIYTTSLLTAMHNKHIHDISKENFTAEYITQWNIPVWKLFENINL